MQKVAAEQQRIARRMRAKPKPGLLEAPRSMVKRLNSLLEEFVK